MHTEASISSNSVDGFASFAVFGNRPLSGEMGEARHQMIETMEPQLASQLPLSTLIAKLTNAGLEPSTAAGIPRWKAVEIVELLGGDLEMASSEAR